MLVVIVLLLVLNRGADPGGPGPAIAEPTVEPTTTSASPQPTATSRSPKPQRTAPVEEPSATTSPRIDKVAVTVLNNSTIQHLAARAAEQLRARSWPIRLVGNYRGRLPVSTLYYLPGQQDVARLLAHEFPAVERVLPRPESLPGSGLTLVVTRDWPT
ncbi:MAG TPA: LytR C-terminal domain-containing protein [Mycobacteriales bacterium]|nr:LytR C-terminal domain-containing protein [Mycobacteriales bacterium]